MTLIEQTAKAWNLPVSDVGDMYAWVRWNVEPGSRGVVLAKMLRRAYRDNHKPRV